MTNRLWGKECCTHKSVSQKFTRRQTYTHTHTFTHTHTQVLEYLQLFYCSRMLCLFTSAFFAVNYFRQQYCLRLVEKLFRSVIIVFDEKKLGQQLVSESDIDDGLYNINKFNRMAMGVKKLTKTINVNQLRPVNTKYLEDQKIRP